MKQSENKGDTAKFDVIYSSPIPIIGLQIEILKLFCEISWVQLLDQ